MSTSRFSQEQVKNLLVDYLFRLETLKIELYERYRAGIVKTSAFKIRLRKLLEVERYVRSHRFIQLKDEPLFKTNLNLSIPDTLTPQERAWPIKFLNQKIRVFEAEREKLAKITQWCEDLEVRSIWNRLKLIFRLSALRKMLLEIDRAIDKTLKDELAIEQLSFNLLKSISTGARDVVPQNENRRYETLIKVFEWVDKSISNIRELKYRIAQERTKNELISRWMDRQYAVVSKNFPPKLPPSPLDTALTLESIDFPWRKNQHKLKRRLTLASEFLSTYAGGSPDKGHHHE